MAHKLETSLKTFQGIDTGLKTSDVRLNNKSCENMQLGDTIIFIARETGQQTSTIITNLNYYKNFTEAFHNINNNRLYPLDQLSNEELVEYMYKYYTKDHELKHGIIEIQIRKMNDEMIKKATH